MDKYNHKKIENKWQNVWEKEQPWKVEINNNAKKFYGLIEFPYPSGAGLHVGHVRSNTAMDIIARKRRTEGYNVLYPIGWDAFGLPTENYAIKTGIHPREVTKQNTDTFRAQLKKIGFSFDWSREINTTDPNYYKWTQWIFLQLLKKGLAYKAKMPINWCLSCKIGLANEEVVDGVCERCGGEVEKREKEQWMLAITKYADRLDKDLDDVDFLEKIKTQQRNWIGKSEGAEIEFKIKNKELGIKVFSTRPDTLFGSTYLVLAPEHDLLKNNKLEIKNRDEVTKYIAEARKKKDIDRTAEGKEKTGVELKGAKAINPANNDEIPIFIADYVLPHYGTGAIMAVPAHDQRDFEFAKKFNLPVKEVIAPYFKSTEGKDAVREGAPVVERDAITAIVKHWKEDKYIILKWKKVDWYTFITGGIEDGQTPEEAAKIEVLEETGYKNLKLIKELSRHEPRFYHVPKKENRVGHFQNFYFQLENDQQEEIEKDEKEKHDVLWMEAKEFETLLTSTGHLFLWDEIKNGSSPHVGDGALVDSGEFNGLDSEDAKKAITEFVGGEMKATYKLRDWVFSRQRYWGEPIPVVHCSKCGTVPLPESELPLQLPVVEKYDLADSGESPLATITDWVNTKCPTCASDARRETDTMPNWAGSSWYFLRYCDPRNSEAFASKESLKYWTPINWYNGGMEHTTLHLLYSRFWHKFLFDIGAVPTHEPYSKRTSHGMILAEDGRKMSKSLGNVINPDEVIKSVGADTLRVYEMFMGPFDQSINWSTNAMVGTRRWLERVWRLQTKLKTRRVMSLEGELHKLIKKVTDDIENMKFNTAIAAMMSFTNLAEKEGIANEQYKLFLQLLAPFAPHITEELWQRYSGEVVPQLAEQSGAMGGATSLLSVHTQQWPEYDISKLRDDTVTIAVQVNSKVRAELETLVDADQDTLKSQALAIPQVQKWLAGHKPKKIIIVPNKIINIVI